MLPWSATCGVAGALTAVETEAAANRQAGTLVEDVLQLVGRDAVAQQVKQEGVEAGAAQAEAVRPLGRDGVGRRRAGTDWRDMASGDGTAHVVPASHRWSANGEEMVIATAPPLRSPDTRPTVQGQPRRACVGTAPERARVAARAALRSRGSRSRVRAARASPSRSY